MQNLLRQAMSNANKRKIIYTKHKTDTTTTTRVCNYVRNHGKKKKKMLELWETL